MNTAPPVKLVAVVGGSGAGKGWLIHQLSQILGDKIGHLQLDDFYRDRSHLPAPLRGRTNFDVPQAIDWEWAERVLGDCRAGLPTIVPCYDFATHRRVSDRRPLAPRPLVIVDGLWLLRPPAIRRLFDLKIYLDAPADLRLSRRLVRDTTVRGYTADAVEHRFHTEVNPMHERYVEPQKKWADVVLTQPFEPAAVNELVDRLWALLADAAVLAPWMHETFRAELFSQLSTHEDSH